MKISRYVYLSMLMLINFACSQGNTIYLQGIYENDTSIEKSLIRSFHFVGKNSVVVTPILGFQEGGFYVTDEDYIRINTEKNIFIVQVKGDKLIALGLATGTFVKKKDSKSTE